MTKGIDKHGFNVPPPNEGNLTLSADQIRDPVPKVGKGKRNPTRWLVGYKDGNTLHDLLVVSAVGAKAAAENYASAAIEGVHDKTPLAVFPLRSGYKKHLSFTVATVTVTQTTITEAK